VCKETVETGFLGIRAVLGTVASRLSTTVMAKGSR
jgi:hypothetical protein